MSNIDQDDKISSNDDSLVIKNSEPQVNLKFIKIVMVSAILLTFVSLFMRVAGSENSSNNSAFTKEQTTNIAVAPSSIKITDADYRTTEKPKNKQDEHIVPPPLSYHYIDPEESSPSKAQPTYVVPVTQPPTSIVADDGRESSMFVKINNTPIAENQYQTSSTPSNTIESYIPDSPYVQQNQQKQNVNFLYGDNPSAMRNDGYLSSHPIYPRSAANEIKAGWQIPITMITGINSDLPGDILAQVNTNVYDSVTGLNILIPAGSRVVGSYNSSVAFGQERVLVVWQRLILPNGTTLNLESMGGADLSGYAGMPGKVDRHFNEIFKVVAFASTFNLGFNATRAALNNVSWLNGLTDAMQPTGDKKTYAEQTRSIIDDYTEKVLNQQPTIVVTAGAAGYIFVNKDILLPIYGYY